MNEQYPNDNVPDEIHRLGQNISQLVKTAWERPERQKFQQELENGLEELGASINQAADDFSKSQTGQQIKNDVNDFSRRISNGEMESKVKVELSSILGEINKSLEQTMNQWSAPTHQDSSSIPTSPSETNSDSPQSEGKE